ncbi:MAG TPA: STAS/SEC14 domain-containing protein [Chryseolinea sp.]|nr:STAS/SEC14 domain-containing protein [Chryseolinea sp.]
MKSYQLTERDDSMVKPFFKDEYATIELDETIPCVKLTLNGIPRYSEHYQFVQTKRLELMREQIRNYPKLHMLTDSRTAGPVLDEDVEHFKTMVMPEMEKAGVRYLAIVMPKNKFTQLTIKEMTEHTPVMTVKYFESMREARYWLRKMTVR